MSVDDNAGLASDEQCDVCGKFGDPCAVLWSETIPYTVVCRSCLVDMLEMIDTDRAADYWTNKGGDRQ